jgi:hypothetical protein
MTTKAAIGCVLIGLLGSCAPAAEPTSPGSASGPAAPREASWPGWVAVELDHRVIEACSGHYPTYWALTDDGAGRVVPRASSAQPRPPRWDALPAAAVPPEVAQAVVSGARRRVIEDEKGWLVAMDAGEFGGGLFTLDKGASTAKSLDAELPERIRWIERFDFGAVGVSGLCHGEGCATASYVYSIERAASGWSVSQLAELKGCPSKILGTPGGSEALLLTCRALHRITASGVAAVAQWQEGLYPVAWEGAAMRDSTGAIFVSFSELIGKFAHEAAPTWFARKSCLQSDVVTDVRAP